MDRAMRLCRSEKHVMWHRAAMLKRLCCMGMLASEYWKQQLEETQICYKVFGAWNSQSTSLAAHLVS